MAELEKRIRELEWQVTQLEHDLIHDPLTGLKTRAYFEGQIGTYLGIILDRDDTEQRKEKFGFRNLGILFCDIDRFKSINDTYGHDMGDVVLRKVAETIRSGLRSGDTVARWGGEEIVASLLGAREEDAKTKAEEVRKTVEALVFPEVPGLKVTVSIGVAASGKRVGLPELIRRADKALYRAKETGRNKVVTHSQLDGDQG